MLLVHCYSHHLHPIHLICSHQGHEKGTKKFPRNLCGWLPDLKKLRIAFYDQIIFFLHLRLINWCMIVATQIIILHTWESMRQDETSFLNVTINLVFDKYFNPGKCLFWFRLVEQGVVLFCQTKQLERPLRVFLLPLCIQNKHNHPKTHLAVHFLCFCGWGLFIAK